jgi:hypothetical protein
MTLRVVSYSGLPTRLAEHVTACFGKDERFRRNLPLGRQSSLANWIKLLPPSGRTLRKSGKLGRLCCVVNKGGLWSRIDS